MCYTCICTLHGFCALQRSSYSHFWSSLGHNRDAYSITPYYISHPINRQDIHFCYCSFFGFSSIGYYFLLLIHSEKPGLAFNFIFKVFLRLYAIKTSWGSSSTLKPHYISPIIYRQTIVIRAILLYFSYLLFL